MLVLPKWSLTRLPSPDQVERPFKTVKLILWNLFELVLLVIAMVAIGAEAIKHIPPFSNLYDPPTVIGAPLAPRPSPSESPVSATPIMQDETVVPRPKNKVKRRVYNRSLPIALELVVPSRPTSPMRVDCPNDSPALNAVAPLAAQQPPIEYPPVPEQMDKPKSKLFVRVVTAPTHAIRWFARGVAAGFRSR